MNIPADMALPAILTQSQAASVAAQLQAAMGQHVGRFHLDASALQQFDSSALAVLLAALRAAARQGLSLQINGLPERAGQLAQVYGLADLFQTPASSSVQA